MASTPPSLPPTKMVITDLNTIDWTKIPGGVDQRRQIERSLQLHMIKAYLDDKISRGTLYYNYNKPQYLYQQLLGEFDIQAHPNMIDHQAFLSQHVTFGPTCTFKQTTLPRLTQKPSTATLYWPPAKLNSIDTLYQVINRTSDQANASTAIAPTGATISTTAVDEDVMEGREQAADLDQPLALRHPNAIRTPELGLFTTRHITKGAPVCVLGKGSSYMNDPTFTYQHLFSAEPGHSAIYDAWKATVDYYHQADKLRTINCVVSNSNDLDILVVVAARDIPTDTELYRSYGFLHWIDEAYKVFDYLLHSSRILGTIKFWHWLVIHYGSLITTHYHVADIDQWNQNYRVLMDYLCGVTLYLRTQNLLGDSQTLSELDLDNVQLSEEQARHCYWIYQFYRTVYLKRIP